MQSCEHIYLTPFIVFLAFVFSTFSPAFFFFLNKKHQRTSGFTLSRLDCGLHEEYLGGCPETPGWFCGDRAATRLPPRSHQPELGLVFTDARAQRAGSQRTITADLQEPDYLHNFRKRRSFPSLPKTLVFSHQTFASWGFFLLNDDKLCVFFVFF